MSAWEVRVRAEVRSAQGQETLYLRDSLPKLIDRIAELLSKDPNKPQAEERAMDISVEHGNERDRQGYSAGDVLKEYHIFRQVLFSSVESETSIDPFSRDCILDIIQRAARQATDQFLKRRGIGYRLTQYTKNKNPGVAISFGILTALAATGVQLAFWDYLVGAAFIIYYPAIVIGSAIGNGWATLVTSIILAQYYFLEPRFDFAITTVHDAAKSVVFFFSGVMIVLLVKLLKKERSIARSEQMRSMAFGKQQESLARIGQLAFTRDTLTSFMDGVLTTVKTAINLDVIQMVQVANTESTDPVVVSEFHSESRLSIEPMKLQAEIEKSFREGVVIRSATTFADGASDINGERLAHVAVVAISRYSEIYGGILAGRKSAQIFTDEEKIFLAAVSDAIRGWVERKSAEEKLKRSEVGLRATNAQLEKESAEITDTLESMSDGFLSVDADWTVTRVNTQMARKLRFPKEDLLGRNFVKVFFGSGELQQNLFYTSCIRCMQERITVTFEDFYSPFNAWSHVSAFPKSDGGIAIFLADITAHKALQDGLISARQDADRANLAKSAFLANMSHEIRTPLGAIMGFSDLARQESVEPKELRSYLDVINRNSNQVLRIIDDILDLAKVEAGRVEIEKLDFSLISFLADFSSLMGFRARENGIAFSLIAERSLPDPIISDPTRLRQILTNAVGNAIKFTKRGYVHLYVKCEGHKLTFRVVDTGLGISNEQAGNLFQAFSQADASTTRKYGGTGLGLLLTRRLCELMNGTYELTRSELEKGSEFTASLQIDMSQSTQLIPPEQISFKTTLQGVPKITTGLLANKRVLVVEDSPDNRALLKILLKQQGAEPLFAMDGKDGVDAIRSSAFDVVLMDIQMPRMDGHEAVRLLRSEGQTLPIIALTAHAMREESERAKASGFSDYVSKPVNKSELVNKILQCLDNVTAVNR